MVSDVRRFFSIGLYRGMVKITRNRLIFCSLSCFALCKSTAFPEQREIVEELLKYNDSSHLSECLEKFLCSSTNPSAEGKKFLNSFVNEINTIYNLNLTIHDACLFVRENLLALQFPQEIQEFVLQAIKAFESKITPSSQCIENANKSVELDSAHLRITWFWSLLGLFKKIEPLPIVSVLPSDPSPSQPKTEAELPGNIYAGSAEVLAGALLLILSQVHPGAGLVGWGLVGDGCRRICDGVVEMGEQNKNNSNNSSEIFKIGF